MNILFTLVYLTLATIGAVTVASWLHKRIIRIIDRLMEGK
jgi:hypothetical protein